MANRRSHLLLVSLILAALVGVGLIAAPQSPLYEKPILGLDLQGGLEVVLEAVPPEGRPLRESDLKRSETIIRNRIDKLGVAEPEVRRQGTNQISVQLAGVRDIRRAQELIGKTAQLHFYKLEDDLVSPSIGTAGFPIPTETLYDLLAGQQSQLKEVGGRDFRVFDKRSKRPVTSAFAIADVARKTKKFDELGKNARVLGVPENRIVITCGGGSAVVCPGVNQVNPTDTYYYLFKYQPDNPTEPIPEMSGEHLRLSGTRADFDSNTGEPIVLMRFTDEGEKRFADITRELAQDGRFKSAGGQEQFQHFAIVLDDEIRSWPSIDFNENPNGISGSNGAQITGMAGLNEAKDLEIVLQTGALPVEFKTLSQTEVSATLGEDSLRQAWQAAIAGLVIVALFLLIAYRFLGLVAIIGLGIYAALLYAVLLLFDVTLTLPGFAGMILTVGVAADANIVVFERIKEESREGKSVRAAIASGYGKGFATIIDANVITAITALVLFSLATAGVKGFALMLLIGTAMSIITAVFATRAMLGLLAGFRWFDRPAFMGATGAHIPNWIRHDYVGKRNLWFAISGAVLAVAIGSLVFQGLNLGIDFKGGTEVGFETTQATTLEDVRAEAAKVGHEDAFIQGIGEEGPGRTYREFQIRAEALTADEQTRLRGALEQNIDAEAFGANTVSASFGSQIARSALWAILISLGLVILYVTIRFQWKFAASTIVALIHDILIAVGIYSLFAFEVSTATVAAFLTVLGYSMYDSVIILDRVRENIPLMRRASIREIGNVSLWETIRRSLATTLITLLPIGALYLFGGETLKDFAFALLIGIGSGAYSSIFLAVPLVALLKEREPDYARRKEADVPQDDGIVAEDALAAAVEAPVPVLAPMTPTERAVATDGDASKRERRRQRRRTRPHGRAR